MVSWVKDRLGIDKVSAIENNIDDGCKDGVCPIPGIRYDLPSKQVLFAPVDKT